LDKASPVAVILVMAFRIAISEMPFWRRRTIMKRLVTRASIFFILNSVVITMGIPILISD
jgi:hypothetical protein